MDPNVIPRPRWKQAVAEIRNDGPAVDECFREAQDEAHRLLAQDGLYDWEVVATSGLAHLGRCDASKRHLRLSLPYIVASRGRDLSGELVTLVRGAAHTDAMRRIAPKARRAVRYALGDGWHFAFSSQPTGFASMTEPGRKRIRIFNEWAREQTYDDLAFVVKESIVDVRTLLRRYGVM